MKRLFVLAMILIMSVCASITTFAAQEVGSGVAGETNNQGSYSTDHEQHGMYDPVSPEDILDLDHVTTDDLQDKIDEKGGDVINVIIRVCRYICIAAFPIGCIMFILGLLGNKKLVAAGVFTIVFAGIGYAGVTCAPEIVHFVASWAAS